MSLTKSSSLLFSFDHVSAGASLAIEFMRTLRIPNDRGLHRLPAGLGRFPIVAVASLENASPERRAMGGWAIPMYQAEAMWMNFRSRYPFMVRVAAGGVSALTGEEWSPVPEPGAEVQDHLVVPEQPWLDGFAVDTGVIRQFVAMPLGEGATVAEQITGGAAPGALTIQVVPMRREAWTATKPDLPVSGDEVIVYSMQEDMGLAAGGLMRQKIYEDPHGAEVWDLGNVQTATVHVLNSLRWRELTGTNPPTTPITAAEYERAGIPWFDHYSELASIAGSDLLAAVEPVGD